MHHLFCFSSSIAQNAVLANVAGIVDDWMTLVNTNSFTNTLGLKLARLYAFGDSMSQVQIFSPLLRIVGPPNIQPFDTAASVSNPPPINMPDNSALFLQPNDPLGVLVSRAGAGASVCKILIWAAPSVPQPTVGAARRVRATATITATQTSWTSGVLTFDQALPTGRWRIIGMSAIGANLFAARLIFPGQTLRPGVLAQQAEGDFEWEWFRSGNFGVFGDFLNTAPPTLQVIAFGANTAQTVWLDLVPISVPGLLADPS